LNNWFLKIVWIYYLDNDMIVETGLPGETGIHFPGIDGALSFVLIDDHPNGLGDPFF
jgi:hypothetical protein